MNQTPRLLEVGDKVILFRSREGGSIHPIDRVTPTRAYAGTMQFKREIRDEARLDEIGRERWATHHYALGTPERLEETRQANKKVNLRHVADEKLAKALRLTRRSELEALEALNTALDAFLSASAE